MTTRFILRFARRVAWGFGCVGLLGLLGLLTCAEAVADAAAPEETEHAHAELVSETGAVQPGKSFTVGLLVKMDPHWHTYWRNPGDSGLATTLDWKLPAGFAAGGIQWPSPRRLAFSTLVNYVYEDQVLLLVDIKPPPTLAAGSTVTLSARADWLVCIQEECIPGGADVSLSLPVKSQTVATNPQWATLFAQARRQLPTDSREWKVRAVRTGNGYRLSADPRGAAGARPRDAYFFSADSGVIEPSAPQQLAAVGVGRSVSLVQSTYASSPAERLHGVWVSSEPDGWGKGVSALAVDVPIETPVTAVAAAEGPTGGGGSSPTSHGDVWEFLGVALTAFVGGLILNLMPCVFPILSIKILGFVQQAGDDRGRIARHGWIYTCGVLTSFWVLAGALLILRSGGNQLAWGYQLQSPLFVLLLCIVLFSLALSLLGVYEMGVGVMAAASRVAPQKGLGGAFLSGALATFLATPCTAPFMGTALAYALTKPAVPALTVFTCLAAGMAAPYLLLSLRPAWLRFLPRPGAWMESLKQFMAFPLFGTVIWLLWVFGLQTGMDGVLQAMAALLLLGLALWAWGRWGAIHRTPTVRRLAAAGLIVGAFVAVDLSLAASKQTPSQTQAAARAGEIAWEPFSAKRLAQLRALGQPVFVDFGAAWCATCIVNDRMVIDTAPVREAFAAKKVVMLRADWTRRDPEITQALAGYGKSGVPFHVLYGGHVDGPLLARDLVAKGELLDALQRLP